MRTERIQQQPGYVLHTRPYQNSSLLVEFFTQDYGRVGAIAQGARRAKSRQAALLQPMQMLSLSWSQRGELARLTGVEAVSGQQSAAAVGIQLWCGLYMNELLMRLTHRGDPHPELFESFTAALAELAADDEMALRHFECSLLAECGYGMPFGADINPQNAYHYEPEQGFVAEAAGEFSGAMLLELASAAVLSPEHRPAARRLMHQAIERHLDRPLQTGRILRSLRRMQTAPQKRPDDGGN